MGDRNARISEAADSCTDAGNDAEGNTGLDERHRLFAAATEDKGITALETQHALALARELDQAQRNVGLLDGGFAAALAGIFELGGRLGEVEDRPIDQCVIDHDISLAETLRSKEGQQAGLARPGAGEPDPAGLEIGKLGQNPFHMAILEPIAPRRASQFWTSTPTITS